MFDVGFWELAVIFVVGLLVLGPERLPKVAQQMGQWAGKARRMARVLTTQIQDEMNAVDPRRIMDPPAPRPAPTPAPEPTYSRPGVDDLKPRDVASEEAAFAAGHAEVPPDAPPVRTGATASATPRAAPTQSTLFPEPPASPAAPAGLAHADSAGPAPAGDARP